MTHDDVDVDAMEEDGRVVVYEKGEASTRISCDVDDLVEDPDAAASLE